MRIVTMPQQGISAINSPLVIPSAARNLLYESIPEKTPGIIEYATRPNKKRPDLSGLSFSNQLMLLPPVVVPVLF